jgi:aspartate aminotransferase
MSIISGRIKKIPPSETLALVARAAQLRAEGKKVISFAAGELDFPTPPTVVDGTLEAIRAGLTKYAPSAGLPELRRAAAACMSRQTGVAVKDENVAVTVGAKQALFNVLLSVLDPGDRVLVLSPYWVSYPAMVSLAGGIPVIYPSRPDGGFKVTGREIAPLIDERGPKAIIVNSPSNPTGAVYSPEQYRDVYETCRKANVFVISDEIYSTLTYDGLAHCSALHMENGVTDSACVVDGMSKSFAMTGWRIGWLVGTPELVGAVSKVSAQTTSCAVTFIQKGCAEALGIKDEAREGWTKQLQARRDRLVSLVNASGHVTCHKPQGAFYVWVDVRSILSRRLPGGKPVGDSAGLSSWLIDDAALVVVPGAAFGCEGFMRFSFAVSMEEIEEGVGRFLRSVAKLS